MRKMLIMSMLIMRGHSNYLCKISRGPRFHEKIANTFVPDFKILKRLRYLHDSEFYLKISVTYNTLRDRSY